MPPKFIYFDLGNVLLNFSDERACRQMAEVCGATPAAVAEAMFPRGLKRGLETGELSNEAFFEAFCRETGTRCDPVALELAGSHIFDVNQTIIPIVAQLESAGYRLGLLSNISEPHWRFILEQRYGIVPRVFEVLILSYQAGAVKPDPKIFEAAAAAAGVPPQDIFFPDNIPGHVEVSMRAGFDAVLYTTTPQLVKDLHDRGVRFNY
jgi:putative hydrolase of the HAD superfamily